MPLGLPKDSNEIEDRLKADVAQEAPDSNPYAANHWLLALIVGIGRRLFDFTRDLQRAVDFSFPDTTFGEGVTRWGAIFGKAQEAAKQSTGIAIATGTDTSVIPSATIMSATVTAEDGSSSSISYETTALATITDNSISISSLNLSGQTVTAVTPTPHNLASNVPVTIGGAIEPEYNVINVEIAVISPTSFVYAIVGSPSSPATGTIIADFTSATVPVISVEFGVNTNLESSTPLTLQAPIPGVNNIFGVGADGLTGGTDQESLDSLQAKTLEEIRDPVAHFNVSDIVAKALEVPTVARVFVQQAGDLVDTFSISSLTRDGDIATAVTTTPHGLFPGDFTTIAGASQTDYNVTDEVVIVIDATTFAYVVENTPVTPATGTITGAGNVPLGSVRIYFITDDDENVIPAAGLVTDVFEQILTILPATTADSDLVVLAPTAVPENFTFTAINPDTPTMEAAIEANLAQFFAEQVDVSVDVDEDKYRAAIIDTIDIETGERLQSFTLFTPVGPLPVANGEIATLGVVTFA